MKKIISLLLAGLMLLPLTACSGTSSNSTEPPEQTNSPVLETEIPAGNYDESDPTVVLKEITNDFADVTSYLLEKQEETFLNVGATYDE